MVVIGKMISDQSCIVWSRGTGFGACYKYSIVCVHTVEQYREGKMRILGAIGVTMGESCTTFKVNGAIYPKARQVPLTEITMAKLLSIFHCLLGRKKKC